MIMEREVDVEFRYSELVDPAKLNAFSALNKIYWTVKPLVQQYGNVRVYNAEECHRPAGNENDPRSAVYVVTANGPVLCTFQMFRNLRSSTITNMNHLMNMMGLPEFTRPMLASVKDYDVKTPGKGIQTMNDHLWGEGPAAKQLEILNKFNTPSKAESALNSGRSICLRVLTGLISHMGPAGQRMPELTAITLLEQTNQKRRMVRVFSGKVFIISDYRKNDASDVELAFWAGDAETSCLILRTLVFLKPILHQLAVKLKADDADQIPFTMVTQSKRVVNDAYNEALASVGLPSCSSTRHVKVLWSQETAGRIASSQAISVYNTAALANHKRNTAEKNYAIDVNIVMAAHEAVSAEHHRWVLGVSDVPPGPPSIAAQPEPNGRSGIIGMQDIQLPEAFPQLRALQRTAMQTILQARAISRQQSRTATALIAIPTGAGKDLLPLALSHAVKGTAVEFVPYVHLLGSTVEYVHQFEGTAELFENVRATNDSAANVVVCSYEHAESATALIRNLDSAGRLAGVIFNEGHVLDPSLCGDFRTFTPVNKMFQNLAQFNTNCTAIFMSATMRHPERVLGFCGLCDPMDAAVVTSPMRPTLKFQLRMLKGDRSVESNQNIMAAAVEEIANHAANSRTICFVMFKHQVDKVVESLQVSFPGRKIIAYDSDRRPDVIDIAADAIIVSTSVLQTGINLAETNLVLQIGGSHAIEDWLQGGGRAGRCDDSQVSVVYLVESAPLVLLAH